MTTAETYVLRISARYGWEHVETSMLPGKVLGQNGRGLELELTLGELHELRNRADYYADPDLGRESGMPELSRSAAKVLEQIKGAGLWELARSPESNAAYDAEWEVRNAALRHPWSRYSEVTA
jgi:hypothetical protein